VEGEATAAYIHRMASVLPRLRVTRLARGLPVGGDLEYADGVTIAEAFSGRREM
jgi:recombination protein RecR